MYKNLIEANSLVKEYKVKNTEDGNVFTRLFKGAGKQTVEALKGVTFSVSEGEFVGLVGNNGAGKSTLVKLMTGILYPGGGTLRVLGRDPFLNREQNSRELGVVFGQRSQLKWDLSPMDSFRLLKMIYRIDSARFVQNVALFEELFDMGGFIGHPVRTLSLGQRMRCEIAAAFLHNPTVEPTIGLDVFSKEAIANFLHVMREKEKVTVILTTHDLEEMGKICDRAIILDRGEILLEEKIDTLLKGYNQNRKVVFSTKNEKVQFEWEEEGITVTKESYRLTVDNVANNRLTALIAYVVSANDVVDMEILEASFTDVIKALLKEGGRAAC